MSGKRSPPVREESPRHFHSNGAFHHLWSASVSSQFFQLFLLLHSAVAIQIHSAICVPVPSSECFIQASQPGHFCDFSFLYYPGQAESSCLSQLSTGHTHCPWKKKLPWFLGAQSIGPEKTKPLIFRQLRLTEVKGPSHGHPQAV